MPAYYKKNKAKLPAIVNNNKAKDNRLAKCKIQNAVSGLVPNQKTASRIVAADNIQHFELPAFTAIIPRVDPTPISTEQSQAIAHLSKLPLYIKQHISTKPPSSKQAMVEHLAKLPVAVNLSNSSLNAYASHVILFMNWFEAVYYTPNQNTQFTVQHIFLWTQHLVEAEYSQPLVYYNSVVNVLSQSYTPAGQRSLSIDPITTFDLEQHRNALVRHTRAFEPSQAPVVYPSLLTSGKLPDQDVAFILIWIYAAIRISSIDTLHITEESPSRITLRMKLLKGKQGNSYLVPICCGCSDEQTSIFCPLHSARYSYKKLVFPLLQSTAKQIVQNAGLSSHSPRVTAAALIDQAMKTEPVAKYILHPKWINSHFIWNGQTSQMFEYYARNSQRILHEMPPIPVLPFIRACMHYGWKENKKVSNQQTFNVTAPPHIIEIINSKQLVPIGDVN